MPSSAGAQAIPALPNDLPTRYAFGFAFVSAAAAMVSIFVSHTCLAVALLLLPFSKTRLRLPSIVWPYAAFLAWTVLSAAVSGEPSAALPQFKKFFVFGAFVAVFCLFRTMDQARRLAEAWFACALAASLWSIVQFVEKWNAAREAGVVFRLAYENDRITGFFSHWMTFSQALLLVFLLLASYLFFSDTARRGGRRVWLGCAAVCGAALALSFTRSVWIAALAAGSYLVWHWRPKLLPVIPVALALAFVAAPGAVRERLESIVNPDAGQARLIMWRTGARMIAAHPWFGVGPERVGPRFREFLPGDVETLPDAYYAHLHNIYVHYAAERGAPAVLLLLWFFAQVLRDHIRALRRLGASGRDDRRFVLHAVVAATLAVMIVGCFDVTLGDSEVLGIYLAMVALGYRAVTIGREQTEGRRV